MNKTFEDLGLSPSTLKALADCGYTSPTPIQQKAIPKILMGNDVVGLAQTGTGKTAGFTLPMIEILSGGRARARMPRSLILAPTRELAAQVAENFDKYSSDHKLTHALLVGGTSMGDQIKVIESGVDVLIATPGRLLDLFGRGKIMLMDIKILVIDEADRMMDMGFIPDIEEIIKKVPKNRQTLLFSATMPPAIRTLAKKFLDNPKDVSVSPPDSTSKNVEQFLVKTTPRNKKAEVLKILKTEDVKNAFIFCNRKRDIDPLVKFLDGKGIKSSPLHGDMTQSARTQTLADVKAGDVRILVCSDVAGRGIDVAGLSHVINYDLPTTPDDYVHRIGRTGRAGEKGRAWALFTDSEAEYLEAIEKLIGKKIPVFNEKSQEKPKPNKAVKKDVPSDKPPEKEKRPPKIANYCGSGFGDDTPAFFKIETNIEED